MPGGRAEHYAPINDYAVIGNGRTVALIARDGAVDWWSAPTVDAPPLCAAILDPDLGGTITVEPAVDYEVSRRYLPDSSVLETTFETDGGRLRLTDSINKGVNGPLPWTEFGRRIEVDRGAVPVRWSVRLERRFTAARPWIRQHEGFVLVHLDEQDVCVVTEGLGTPEIGDGVVSGEFTVRPGERCLLALTAVQGAPLQIPRPDAVHDRLDATVDEHRRWRERIHYDGVAADAVLRSASTLRLLTSTVSGAQAAAATTSLPERIGGSRNFDYRFSWVRDTAFALDALTGLGLRGELHATLSYLLRAVARTAPDVRVCYTMAGAAAPASTSPVPLWRGYRGSRPVQVGNGAAGQRQLGAYGDLLETVHRYVEHGNVLDGATGRLVARIADQVVEQWAEDDAGLWELGRTRPYTSSKIGCWAALDRAVRIAEAGQAPGESAGRWRAAAEEIHEYVDAWCWSPAKRSYTFYAGTDDLDAATLLAARTGFCAGDDPRLHGTIDAVRDELSAGGPLLYRYTGMQGAEGAFVACSFWLVEALTVAGRLDEAREVMDAMVDRANDVGLLSEEIDPGTGELLGNFPQALSHLALITAAVRYSRAVSRG